MTSLQRRFVSSAQTAPNGQGCVFPLCGEDESGSTKLDKHLPETPFKQCKVTRIVVYPLLVHSLKNETGMNWQKMFTGIRGLS